MLRYLAVLWDPADGDASSITECIAGRATEGMSLAVRANGLLVWSNEAIAEPVSAAQSMRVSGVVLGKLFKREFNGRHAQVQTSFVVTPDSKIAREGGHHLLKHYWGRYVAIVRCERSGLTWLLRDPSGGLPCFFVVYRGVFIFFSHVEDCAALQLMGFDVNWKYIAAYLVAPSLCPQQTQTGLRGVSEVLKGECIEIRGSVCTRTLYWNPLQIAAADPIEDSAAAIRQMRDTIQACVTTWAASYRQIIHRISGGLDSSIVLACLSKASARVPFTCVTRYDHSAWGDERDFARLAAHHARCDLIEHLQDAANVDFDSMLAGARSASPVAYMLAFTYHVVFSQLAARLNADALFSGGGGDAVFFRDPGELWPVADYLYCHPFGTRLARVAFDTALANKRAIWNVVPIAFLYGLLRRNCDVLQDLGRDVALVEPGAVADVKRSGFLQPAWLSDPSNIPPGKLRHIHRMHIPEWSFNPYASSGYPDEVAPLLSQPIVELMLRIPTYLLIAGGRDRMLARRAFAQDLPPQLIARNSKGGQAEFSSQVLRRNERRIREMMLDGRLCRTGLVNRRKMEAVLSAKYDTNTDGLMEILHTHLNVEIWLQKMKG